LKGAQDFCSIRAHPNAMNQQGQNILEVWRNTKKK
jgi:hypothetical protein